MIDSHAHLYFDRFDEDRDEVIQRARDAGVDRMINIGIDVSTSQAAIDLAHRHRGFYAAVGLHPTSPIDDLEQDLEAIRNLAESHQDHVVAIGEFGLDYYWKDISPEEQRPRLESQLELALDLELPVIFHCRDALEELLGTLEAKPRRAPGVFHCFGGGADEARRALALGYHVSFAGNVTFPKATDLQAAADVVPLDKLLLETDCPFLAPQPRRGKRNEPAHVAHIRDFLAERKGVSAQELETVTVANTEKLFRLT